MSLINDMLKDLEKRHAEEAYPKGVVLAGIGLPPPAARMHSAQWLLYLGGALAATILVFALKDGFYHGAPSQDAGIAAPAFQAPQVSSPEPPPQVAAASVPPSMVASIAPPAADGASSGSALERHAVQDQPAPAVLGEGVEPGNAVDADAGQGGGAVDHNTAKASQAAESDGESRIHDVKQPVAAKPRDGDGEAAGVAARETAQVPPQQALASSRQASSAAPVRMKKSVHPLTARERARRLRGEALRLARRGNLDEAEDKLTKALSLEPRHVAARGALAGLMIQNGQLNRAAALLDQGLTLKPGSAALIELRARVYVMQGDNQRARSLLEENAPKVGQDPEYHAMLAAVYQRLGDYDKAGAVYQELVNQKPENGVWWLGLGLSMEATGRVKEARQAYEKAQLSQVLSPKLRQFVKDKLSSLS